MPLGQTLLLFIHNKETSTCIEAKHVTETARQHLWEGSNWTESGTPHTLCATQEGPRAGKPFHSLQEICHAFIIFM